MKTLTFALLFSLLELKIVELQSATIDGVTGICCSGHVAVLHDVELVQSSLFFGGFQGKKRPQQSKEFWALEGVLAQQNLEQREKESEERTRKGRGRREGKTKWTHVIVCSNWNFVCGAVEEGFAGVDKVGTGQAHKL